MKKKKILIGLAFIFLFMVFPKLVDAAELRGYAKCSYTLSKGSANTKYSSGSRVDFYYTDLFIENKPTNGMLAVKGSSGYTDLKDALSDKLFSNVKKLKDKNKGRISEIDSEFSKASVSTGCPYGFVVKSSGDMHFVSNSSEVASYCGSDKSNCEIVSESVDPDIEYINTKELTWKKTYTCGSGTKADTLNVVLYFADDGKFKANIEVDKSSELYTSSAQGKQIVDVTDGGSNKKNIGKQISVIGDFINNNRISKHFIRYDNGHYKFVIDDSGVADATCTVKSGTSYEESYNCLRANDVDVSPITSINNDISTMKKKITDAGLGKCSGSCTATTIPSNLSKSEIDSKVNTADSIIKLLDSLEPKVKEFQSKISTAIKNSCESAKAGMEEYNDSLEKYNDEIQKMREIVVNACASLKKQANEKGYTSTANKIEGMEAKLDELKGKYDDISRKIVSSRNYYFTSAGSGISATSPAEILDSELVDFLNTILWYIKIAGLVLAIVLSMTDYVKASAGMDDKSIGAANKKFVTRLILVAVLFLLKPLLEFVLGILNISTTAESLEALFRIIK